MVYLHSRERDLFINKWHYSFLREIFDLKIGDKYLSLLNRVIFVLFGDDAEKACLNAKEFQQKLSSNVRRNSRFSGFIFLSFFASSLLSNNFIVLGFDYQDDLTWFTE